MRYFITAIDTDSGKTLVSAIFCEALNADYWKPIQAGFPRDTETVRDLVSNRESRFHDESVLLKTAASPHAAAALENRAISLADFKIPATNHPLIIEGAGGCMVPLNKTELVIDMISLFGAKAVVVADLYLGSINHTLLTVDALMHRKIEVAGIVFNGEPNPASEQIILHRTGLKPLLHIMHEPEINRSVVKRYSELLKKNL